MGLNKPLEPLRDIYQPLKVPDIQGTLETAESFLNKLFKYPMKNTTLDHPLHITVIIAMNSTTSILVIGLPTLRIIIDMILYL